jgi:hypothetical protein
MSSSVAARMNDPIADRGRVVDESHRVVEVERLVSEHDVAAQGAPRADGGGQ